MPLKDRVPGIGSKDHECRGHYGVIEDEDGSPTEGIELKCRGKDEPVRVPGSRKEAEQKADKWLEQEGMTALVDL